jgi:hypothetical protein
MTTDARAVPPFPLTQPRALSAAAPPPAVVISPGAAVALLTRAAVGTALFGFALRTAAERALPGPGHLIWAAALPATLFLAWLVSLPALYILWAAREPSVGIAHVMQATADALGTVGACLASTAPILWFFAVTAPQSRILSPLGFLFTAFALIGSGVVFGNSLRRMRVPIHGLVQLAFLGLVLLTFLEFASRAGLHWF